MNIPIELGDVQVISAMQDPILRNLWITQGYHDLNQRLSAHLSGEGTWLMYGVWASKSVGANLRQDELSQIIREEYAALHELQEALNKLNQNSWLKRLGIVRFLEEDTILGTFENTLSSVVEHLAAGNQMVFAELAPVYANIIRELDAGHVLSGDALETFVAAQKLEGTVESEAAFRDAIRNYFLVFSSANQRERAQRICYANLLAGLHEQQRLQQAVEQAMDAPITEGLANVRHIWIFRVLSKVPVLGGLLRKLDAEFFKHETKIEQAFNVLATRLAMSITTPNGTFRLGKPLPPPPDAPMYPEDLDPVALPELKALIKKWDRSGPDRSDTAAHNWAVLEDRMNLIFALFRSRQQVAVLHNQPFSEAQRAELQAGKMPSGEL